MKSRVARPALILWALAAPAAAQTPGIDLQDLKKSFDVEGLHERIPNAAAWRKTHARRFDASSGEASFDVKSYALNLAADPVAGTLSGTNRVTVASSSDALSAVTFQATNMRILAVTDAKGEALPFRYDGADLVVSLPRPWARGDEGAIAIRYEATRPQAFNTTGPDATNPKRMKAAYTYTQPIGAREWFPSVDRPDDKALADIRVTVPEGYAVLSNGDLTERSARDGRVTYAYRMDEPIATYLVSLNIGAYDVVSLGSFQGKPVTLWTPPAIKEKAVAETAETPRMIATFSAFTGMPYPFHAYAQSVAQAWTSSMEHQSATTMGGWRITGDGTGVVVVAHELAHQWFGDWVTCADWGELWLNEGFATYLPYVYSTHAGKDIDALGQLDGWRQGYIAESKQKVRPLSDIGMPLDEIFDAHSYDKGGLVLHLLRHVVNAAKPAEPGQPETFSLALKAYLTAHGGGNVVNRDLQTAMEEATGESFQTFFDQWVRAPGHPVLDVSYAAEGDTLKVRVRQEQALRAQRRWGVFAFPLDLELVHEDGSVTRKTLRVKGSDETFSLPVPKAVVALVADPDWLVPSEITVAQSVDSWRKILASSPSVPARTTAMRVIAAAGPVNDADVTAIAKDPSVYVKTDALERLTTRPENLAAVSRLADALRRERRIPLLTRGALARTEVWQARTRGVTASPRDEASWRQRYLSSPWSEERNAMLSLLAMANLGRAQNFALERLQEPGWTTRDRVYLVNLLTKEPTATSLPFVTALLDGGSKMFVRTVLDNLITARFDEGTLVAPLAKGVVAYPYTAARVKMVELLGLQKSHKDEACPHLKAFAEHAVGPSVNDPWITLKEAARKAQEGLACPTP